MTNYPHKSLSTGNHREQPAGEVEYEAGRKMSEHENSTSSTNPNNTVEILNEWRKKLEL